MAQPWETGALPFRGRDRRLANAGVFQRKRPLSVERPATTIAQSKLGRDKQIMTADPDPYGQGQRAARENIPAGAIPTKTGARSIRFGLQDILPLEHE
jgi:hypothetical protein